MFISFIKLDNYFPIPWEKGQNSKVFQDHVALPNVLTVFSIFPLIKHF